MLLLSSRRTSLCITLETSTAVAIPTRLESFSNLPDGCCASLLAFSAVGVLGVAVPRARLSLLSYAGFDLLCFPLGCPPCLFSGLPFGLSALLVTFALISAWLLFGLSFSISPRRLLALRLFLYLSSVYHTIHSWGLKICSISLAKSTVIICV
jgi:hypothetical protein